MKRFAIPSLLTLLVAFACQDAGVLTDTGMNNPDFLIRDGANAGNEDFWFLPPVLSNPAGNPEFEPEEFNPNLKPIVRICARASASATWSCPAPGYVEGPADLEDDHYHFNWKTKKSDNGVYRVEVLLGTLRLGFFDAEVSKKGKNADSGNVPVKAGRNVPVKTAIETNAACIALNPSFDPDEDTCSTAALNGGESLQLGNDANAKVNNGGTINMTFCTNLRERVSKTDGRVDIPTFGPCVEIENLEDFVVSGTATICEAFDLAVVEDGLSHTQAERMTVHRHGDNDPMGAVALPHGDGATCTTQAFEIESRLERLALQFGESIWNAVVAAGDHVLAFVGPQPLMACNRGGCGSPTEFESSYQVALPTLMEFHEDNPGGDLGDRLVGTVVTAKIQAWDSGELEDEEEDSDPEPVENVRLAVALATGSPGSIVGPDTIYTDSDGVATFQLEVGSGTNVVEVSGIGVGTISVYGPSILDENASLVQLGVGTLTFTARSITLVGSSTVLAGDTLRLTADSPYTAGAAWTQDKKTLDGGFTAAFSFRISDPDIPLDGADGIAFVIQNLQGDTIGGLGGALGYGGATKITPSFAVEFDTWQNGETDVNDPNSNHIALHFNGDLDEAGNANLVLNPAGITLYDGTVHDVEIVYTAGTDQLTVSLDGNLVLTATVDLSSVLDVNGKAWVGFTSATGAAYEKHDVFNIEIDIP